jgi:hypothetical protein
VLSDHGLFHGRYHDMEMFGHIDRSRADQVS